MNFKLAMINMFKKWDDKIENFSWKLETMKKDQI